MKKILLGLALVAATLLCSPSTAEAVLKIRLSSTLSGGSTTFTDTDGDGVLSTGLVDVGSFDVTFSIAMSKPLIGSAGSPEIHYTYSTTKIGPADTLFVEITDTDFGPVTPYALQNQIGGVLGGSITSVTQVSGWDDSNTEFSLASGSSAPMVFTSSPYSGANSFGPAGASPYSLTATVSIAGGDGTGTSSGDGLITGVPAPAGLVLLACGLPCLAAGYLRRKKVAKA